MKNSEPEAFGESAPVLFTSTRPSLSGCRYSPVAAWSISGSEGVNEAENESFFFLKERKKRLFTTPEDVCLGLFWLLFVCLFFNHGCPSSGDMAGQEYQAFRQDVAGSGSPATGHIFLRRSGPCSGIR